MEQEIKEACQQVEVEITYKEEEQQVILNKENVTCFLREEETGKMAGALERLCSVCHRSQTDGEDHGDSEVCL